MRVLFVTNMYPIQSMSYFGIFVKEQIEHLQKNCDVESEVYFINARDRGKLEYLKSMFRLPKLIRSLQADAVHIHYGISGLFLFFSRPKVPVFLTLHGGDILKKQGFYFQNILTRWIMRKVDKVFILNQEMQAEVEELNVAYEHLPCGVNTDFFKANQNGDDHQNPRLVLFPGDPNLTVKDYPLFKASIERLREMSGEHIRHECIIGMNREQVRQKLWEADCMLMTSVSEGSPQIIKEALACNLPVVSVEVGDVREVLDGIPSCYIADEREPMLLARLVEKALTSPSSEIREHFLAKGKYDNRSVCTKLVANYAKLF